MPNGSGRGGKGLAVLGVIAALVAVIVYTSHARKQGAAGPAADDAALPKKLRLAGPAGASPRDLETCVAILRRRFERAEIPARANVLDGRTILVSLPDDPDLLVRAGSLLAAGGHLQFKLVLGSTRDASFRDRIAEIRAKKERGEYDAAKEPCDALPDAQEPGKLWLVDNREGVEGHFVATAKARYSQNRGGYVVDFTLSPEGSDVYYEFTKRIVGRLKANILDGVVKSVFTIDEPIRDTGTLYKKTRVGGYAKAEALELAALMTSGQLPIELSLEEDDVKPEAPEAAPKAPESGGG